MLSQSSQAENQSLPTARPSKRKSLPRGTSAYPRTRAVTACQVCRSRRRKCDNAKPSCSFCLKVGAQCVRSPVDFSSFDPASLQILERLDDLEGLLEKISGDSWPGDRSQQRQAGQEIQRPKLSDLLPVPLENFFTWTDFEGLQAWQRLPLLTVLRQRSATSSRTNFNASPASFNLDFEVHTTTALLDSFFQYCHVKNPIFVSEAAIRRMVSQRCLHGIDWSAQSCLALLICALGAISTPFGDSDTTLPGTVAYITAQSYFQAARKRLGGGSDASGETEAQCFFLAGVYSMCIFQPATAWKYFNQALACCQEFDLVTQAALSTDGAEPFQLQETQASWSAAEQAIYWSSWKSERELRASLQPHDFRPRDIEHYLCPSFLPTPPSPSERDEQEGDSSPAERERSSWYFYLTEISLRRLASRLSTEILTFQSGAQPEWLSILTETLPTREAQIDEWAASLPDAISLGSDPRNDEVTRYVLRGHLLDLRAMLYWPFLDGYIRRLDELEHNGTTNSLTLYNGSVVEPEFQRLAEKSLWIHVERLRVNRPGLKHRHHGTWFMIRSCTGSALILIKAALYLRRCWLPQGHVSRLNMPEGWMEAIVESVDLNRYWQMEAADAFERAPLLEQLLATVRSY